jgi:hypothetical protein
MRACANSHGIEVRTDHTIDVLERNAIVRSSFQRTEEIKEVEAGPGAKPDM